MISIVSQKEWEHLRTEIKEQSDLIIVVTDSQDVAGVWVAKNRFGATRPLLYLRSMYDLIESYVKLVY